MFVPYSIPQECLMLDVRFLRDPMHRYHTSLFEFFVEYCSLKFKVKYTNFSLLFTFKLMILDLDQQLPLSSLPLTLLSPLPPPRRSQLSSLIKLLWPNFFFLFSFLFCYYYYFL